VGQWEISRCWQAHLAGRAQLRQGREEGEDDGTYVQEAKIAGDLDEQGAKTYSSQGQIKNI
jgi:hypothetical protein